MQLVDLPNEVLQIVINQVRSAPNACVTLLLHQVEEVVTTRASTVNYRNFGIKSHDFMHSSCNLWYWLVWWSGSILVPVVPALF
jgi:hypothetical protein